MAPPDDDDPLAPVVAALIVATIVLALVAFVLISGGAVSAAAIGRILRSYGPWYLGLAATVLIARWLGRRKRRR